MNYEDYKAKFTDCAMNFYPRTRKLQKLPATACWAAANASAPCWRWPPVN